MAEIFRCDADRLSRFFQQLGEHDWCKPIVPRGNTLSDYRDLDALFSKMRIPLRNARLANVSNPWATAGLGTDEVRICSVLSALWDVNAYGAEARNFLQRFLTVLAEKSGLEIELDDNYRVQTEHCLNGSVSDRVDITIETCAAVIGIEVKINASERENQLRDYSAAISKRAKLMKRGKNTVVFLSPYSSVDKSYSAPHFTWQELAKIAELADQTSNSGWLIQQFGRFCKSLGN